VRGPSARKADEEDFEPSAAGDVDQKKLRARIEAKRQDDLVRKREFSYLRKLVAKRHAATRGMVGSSVFTNSSGYAQTDRATNNRAATVKKIDAIEASMSEQWTRRKPLVSDGTPHKPTESAPIAPTVPGATAQALMDKPERSSDAPDSAMDFDLDFTGLASGPAPLHADRAQRVPMVSDNPALQAAAMRFAEGEYLSAQSVLQTTMHDPDATDDQVDACTLALVDMYRGQGDAVKFDAIAIEYATRFGRSAPEWYSVPRNLGLTSPEPAPQSTPADTSLWACPPMIDAAAVARLAASQSERDVRLVNWGQLQQVSGDAVRPLSRLFSQWAAKPGNLIFDGIGILNAVLEAATPMNDRSIAPDYWLLRLETLRLQGHHGQYETVALDYCVTYEVSPPSWISPVCEFNTATPVSHHESGIPGDSETPDSVPIGISGFGFVEKMVLQGDLLGDAGLGIEHLIVRALPGAPIVIDCRNLVRVDFAAAGRLLNWLAQHEAENVFVQFVNVPRLVLAFFQEMGITEFAEVSASIK
jgi:ABC-type transporter Mla MlaB component